MYHQLVGSYCNLLNNKIRLFIKQILNIRITTVMLRPKISQVRTGKKKIIKTKRSTYIQFPIKRVGGGLDFKTKYSNVI